jgi:ABC-type transport system involved in cytochrome bd biosynthesis fused ATPase/permease subunit
MSVEAGRENHSVKAAGGGTNPQAIQANRPAADGATSLQAIDLTPGFGEKVILGNVDVEVRRGAITALIGPTGSGKTTLLRTFNRMNDKVTGYRHSGDVLLDGKSIWQPGLELMALRRRVGMLFQRPNPFPMSIMDNVVAGVKAHRMASKNGLKAIAQQRLTRSGSGTPCRTGSRTHHSGSPAASSNCCAWLGRWRSVLRCCCSTSPHPRLTRWPPSPSSA